MSRADWNSVVVRGTPSDEDDDLYWLSLSIAERIELTWDLSRELFTIAALNGGYFDEESGEMVNLSPDDIERRLPRADYVVTRR